jgi:hypothetical protein
MLTIFASIAILTNCSKNEFSEKPSEPNYPYYPYTKDILITNITVSNLADSVTKYNQLGQAHNWFIDGQVIIDNPVKIPIAFNQSDIQHINPVSTGIEVIHKKSLYNGTVPVEIPAGLTTKCYTLI